MTEWISVDQILPQESCDVLVYLSENNNGDYLVFGNIFRGFWHDASGWENYNGNPVWSVYGVIKHNITSLSSQIDKIYGVKVTHWMRLPKAPK